MEDSGGGVTLCGGEPLMHPDYALEILKELGRRGFHRTVDTTLYVSEETLRTICPEMYEDGAALSVLEKKYTVPYIMWANFDLTSEELQFTSPNFLRSYLLENAGIEGSAYDRFTAAVRREYPAINILGYSDAAGELHSVSELGQEPLLSDYRKVAYYNLFDHGKVKKSLFE